MSWLSTREYIEAICVMSIFFLLGGGGLINLGLTDSIASTGITLAHILSAGLLYVLGAFYFKYI